MQKIKCDNIQCRRAETCANYLPWEPCTIQRFDDGDSCPPLPAERRTDTGRQLRLRALPLLRGGETSGGRHTPHPVHDGIDKLTNEKKELVKILQNSSADKKEEDAQQKAISDCVDLVNQIYDFCKEHNLRLSMDFTHDGNDPRIAVWNNVDGDKALCHVVYSFDWITTLKRLINGAKNGYEIWTQAKHNACTAKRKAYEDGKTKSVASSD